MRYLLPSLVLLLSFHLYAQVLVDSISFESYGSNANFYGMDGEGDVLYLGSDFDGQIIAFSTSTETEVASYESPYDFCHGLAKTENGFYIVEDYSSSGAQLFEINENSNELGVYDLPEGILGPPGGVGGLDLVGDAVWFTVYYQDSDTFPYAYAYLWDPVQELYLDTVPMSGGQPHGIEQIGNLLIYVIDDNDDDLERLYGYDLDLEEEVFAIDLPDTQNDNDQSPRGLHYDGSHLWLMADRAGPSAFPYNMLYKYDVSLLLSSLTEDEITFTLYPNPASNTLNIKLLDQYQADQIRILDITGKIVHSVPFESEIDIRDLNTGAFLIEIMGESWSSIRPFMITRQE